MHETSMQRVSEDVPRVDDADVRADPLQDGSREDDPLDDPAVSVSTSLMTEEHATTPIVKKPSESLKVSTEPATLERKWLYSWGSASLDILGALLSLFFLVVASLSLSLNGNPVSAYGQDIKALTLLSPTIFPIVYAAILGKFLRRIGLFKAERGSTIGTLEQLIGSQSFFASIERQVGLRRMDLLGVTIIAAWLLSPLGGQASLRLLSTSRSEMVIDATVYYHKVDTFANSTMLDPHMEEYNWARYAPLFMSTLQFARQNFNQSRDLFGNIRIPDMTSLATGTDTSDAEWYSISDDSSPLYTSLLGSPVVGIPSSGNLTFMIESSYWEVRCGPFTSSESFENNATIPAGIGRVLPSFSGPTFDLVQWYSRDDNDTQPDFKYVTKFGYTTFKYSNCTAALRIVESEVGCQQGLCDVQRMRTSSQSASTLASLMAPKYTNHRFFFAMLCEFFPGADMGPTKKLSRVSELVEQWIWDPSLLNILQSFGAWRSVNITDLSPEVFSQRFQIALNTFWDSSLGFNHMATNATSQVHNYDNTISRPWTGTKAQGTDVDTERYVCNITFAILTIVISLLLFAAAATSAILGSITKAPDILGYVSTLARDDPYFGTTVPSHQSGLEAARTLRDVRVIIGDVRKESDVGHIAFAAAAAIDAERVKKKRAYD
ncbi:hypothetical protein DE146DRAFT_212907 [Phaeosphaeria sp. MPI-PUGE-AT-0046c]|nr:hypothetical protein DE146DRAFT_212907 [Phaeosphaeria sp. MPI-PUGE-AT-0046c]